MPKSLRHSCRSELRLCPLFPEGQTMPSPHRGSVRSSPTITRRLNTASHHRRPADPRCKLGDRTVFRRGPAYCLDHRFVASGDDEIVRSLRRRRESGRNDRSASPSRTGQSNRNQRNSLSGEHVARRGGDSTSKPAHNGEALPGCSEQGRSDSRRVTSWEALCHRSVVWPRND